MTRFIKDTPFGVTEEIGELYGKNLFAYCGNNPVNQTDANGQWWDWISNIALSPRRSSTHGTETDSPLLKYLDSRTPASIETEDGGWSYLFILQN